MASFRIPHRRLNHDESGNESVQTVLILAVGALILLALQQLSQGTLPKIRQQIAALLSGQDTPTFSASNDQAGGVSAPGPTTDSQQNPGDSDSSDAAANPAANPQAVVFQTESGSFESRSDDIDSDGEFTEASPQEQINNRAAILAAIDASPEGIAVVGGDHAGGASNLPSMITITYS